MEVKYLTSLPAGAALGEGFIWAKARSDEAVIRPIRRSRSARMRNSSKYRIGRYRQVPSIPAESEPGWAFTSKPRHSSPKKKAARRRPSSIGNVGQRAALRSG